MAENKGLMGQLGEAAKNNPAVDRLREEATSFLQVKGQDLTKNIGSRLENATGRLQETTDGGGFRGKGDAGGNGDNPIKGALKNAVGGLKDQVKDKIPGMGSDGGSGGGGDGGGKATKSTVIIEDIDVGASVRVVYNQWTQYGDFPTFMKKVEHAEQDDDEPTVNFKAQVLWSHRTWQATIKEQVPEEKISWRSSGEKGRVDGTLTFHEIAPRLTRVVLVLEYYPQGLFERTGNIWRAQGRRARLELKHFRRHVMMTAMHDPDQLEGWRGEIHGEEVTRTHDEAVDESTDEDQPGEEEPSDQSDQEDSEHQDEEEADEADEGSERDQDTPPRRRRRRRAA